MTTQQTAIENLRVIRSLMEKANIYRAISAPAAIFGGLLALLLGGSLSVPLLREELGPRVAPTSFLMLWLGVLLATGILNTILLAREAAKRDQPFVSDGMRMALRAFLPPMGVGGVVGIVLIVHLENMTFAALFWALFYGLALVATSSFSPRSLVRLGWLFIIVGLLLFTAVAANQQLRMLPSDEGPASIIMAITFGLLHIGYGLAVAMNKKQEAPSND